MTSSVNFERRRLVLGAAAVAGGGKLISRTGIALAVEKKEMKDVVIIIPGIMGSVLMKDGREVWGASWGTLMNTIFSRGNALDVLKLGGDSIEREDIEDGIVAERLFPTAHLIPYFWTIDGYTELTDWVQAKFNVQPGQNYFEFAYDWRRDVRASARRLEKFVYDRLKKWRSTSGAQDAKLVFLCHSMGGLVAHYFIEALHGWKDTRTLFTLGTPFWGSMNALETLATTPLARGRSGIAPDLTHLIRTFTSAYQLLPNCRCVSTGEGLSTLFDSRVSLNLPPEKLSASEELRDGLELAVTENSGRESYVGSYKHYAVIGTFQDTKQYAEIGSGGPRFSNTLRTGTKTYEEGDGTVPVYSAIPRKYVNEPQKFNIAQQHASLQKDPRVLEQIRAVLSFEDPGPRGDDNVGALDIALSVNSLYLSDESIVIHAKCSVDRCPLQVMMKNTLSGAVVVSARLLDQGEGMHKVELRPGEPGTYRVTVSTIDGFGSVSDCFVVAPRDYQSS